MTCVVVVPGLSAALAQPELAGRAPSAVRLLAVGRRYPEPAWTLDAWMTTHLGLTDGAAAWQAAAVLPAVAPGYWLRADPVHLRLDQRGAQLLELDGVPPWATVQAVLQAYGAHLQVPEPHYGLLHWPASDAAVPGGLPALAMVRGRHVQEFLLQGDSLTRRLFSELQISLHADSGAAGGVNALWLWGGGHWPAPSPQRLPAGAQLWTDRRWLAAWGQGQAPCATTAGYHPPATGLAVLDALEVPWAYGDFAKLGQILVNYEQRWFAPLLRALRRGLLRQLILYPLAGTRYELRTSLLRRWFF